VTDEYPTRLEPVTAWAVLRRTHHPLPLVQRTRSLMAGTKGRRRRVDSCA
jgi:hypothetical protein